jgi:hypothetical protein
VSETSSIVSPALAALQGLGIWAQRLAVGGRRKMRSGAAGTADILACVGGWFVAFEAKLPGEKLTPKQEAWGRALTLAGGKYIVVRSVQDVLDAVEHIRVDQVKRAWLIAHGLTAPLGNAKGCKVWRVLG